MNTPRLFQFSNIHLMTSGGFLTGTSPYLPVLMKSWISLLTALSAALSLAAICWDLETSSVPSQFFRRFDFYS